MLILMIMMMVMMMMMTRRRPRALGQGRGTIDGDLVDTHTYTHTQTYFPVSFLFLFSIILCTLGFIWDIGLYLRTSLYFCFYFRACTYLQLIGDLDMYASYIYFSFLLFIALVNENPGSNLPLSNPLGRRSHERSLDMKSHIPDRKGNLKP